MYYFIGDIHGYYNSLVNLFSVLEGHLRPEDTVVFLGDYIDRGSQSYEVIDFLILCSQTSKFKTVFLKGNHEDMLFKYLAGEDKGGIFMFNGGDATIRSYNKHCGIFKLPQHHRRFFDNLKLYYEGEDFIAVHAGLDPKIDNIASQDENDLLWIRDKFFRSQKRWDKTVIFGHTPTSYISRMSGVYIDDKRNIIGIDSGVIFGKQLSCLRWPDRSIFTG